MKKSNFWKSYGFLILMLTGIVAGCVVGAIWPAVMEVVDGETIIVDKGATVLEPLGTVFLNLMFCIAVPTVFCSISSSIANMQSARRAGKIMGVTIATFLVTAAFAAVIMYVTVRLIPPVVGEYALVEGEVGGTLGVADMIVNFFTKPDFTELFSRRAILPLIVAAILFGGIPHLALEVPALAKQSEDALRRLGRALRYHPALPKGANVNFYELTGPDEILEKTYERGVEDFTLACGTGTGSVAAALTLLGRVSGKNVRVRMDGGELTVDAEEKDGSIENLYLTGPAAMVCAGEILDEAILKLVKRQEEKT